MKLKNIYISSVIVGLFMIIALSCEKDKVYPESDYFSNLSFSDSSSTHPKQTSYQSILDKFVYQGAVGLSVMIKDGYGTWIGAAGKADIASNVDMQVGNQFLIASISKVFTSTAIYSYVDDGLLSIEDPVNKWLDKSVCDKVDNANETQIKHLLSHRSGIHDYYTMAFEMARYNRKNNYWSQEEVLAYTYGKKANFSVDAKYEYSNTNYVLLGMILEKVSGLTLKEVYQTKIFDPLNLESAYYGTRQDATPDGLVKGYMDLYETGDYVESDYFYQDELSTGDGGIAINVQDLGMFMNELMHGNIISQSSMDAMQNWFDKPKEYDKDVQTKNGYGLEYFDNKYGVAYGHTGSMDGFESTLNYYPEGDITIAFLFNHSYGTYDAYLNATEFTESLEKAVFE